MDLNFIDNEHAKSVCKIGQGAECCRYLAIGPNGWSCEKFSELSLVLDMRVAAGRMVAQSDNCEGRLPR